MNSPIDLPPDASAPLVAVVLLLVVLIGREMAAVAGPRFQPLARNLTVLVTPFLVVFALVAANRVLIAVMAPLEAASLPGRVLLDESFAEPRPGWPDDPRGSAWFAEGTYWLTPRPADGSDAFVSVEVPLPRALPGLTVSARLRKQGGPPGGSYGLALRDGSSPADRYYLLAVADQGEVSIWGWDQDHWVDLVAWQPASAVRTAPRANDVEASTQAGRLRLVVNGEPVASANVGLTSGVLVGVFAAGESNAVTLEHLAVTLPD